MGLAERRRIAVIKDQHGPQLQKELNAAIGFDLPLELDVASFPENSTILDCYEYYYDSYGPTLLVKVFKEICIDEMGKEATKAKIKKIVFQNSAKNPEAPGEKEIKLETDTLFVRESFHGSSEKLFSDSELKTAIENIL
jgi:hypothetical protein